MVSLLKRCPLLWWWWWLHVLADMAWHCSVHVPCGTAMLQSGCLFQHQGHRAEVSLIAVLNRWGGDAGAELWIFVTHP